MTEGTSGEFDPNAENTNGSGKDKIVSLILPDTATSIKAGTVYGSTFKEHFTELKSVSGANVAAISDYALRGCNKLTTVDFPTATSIGEYAFCECTALTEVNFPEVQTIVYGAFTACSNLAEASFLKAETIGVDAFQYCSALAEVNLSSAKSIGTAAFTSTGSGDLTITLGKTPPTVEWGVFHIINAPKTVIVKVPSDAEEGYGEVPYEYSSTDSENNWGNAFRGKGWNGETYGNDSVQSNINLTIQSLEAPATPE
jgi:hypothetical protein